MAARSKLSKLRSDSQQMGNSASPTAISSSRLASQKSAIGVKVVGKRKKGCSQALTNQLTPNVSRIQTPPRIAELATADFVNSVSNNPTAASQRSGTSQTSCSAR